jgi:hypothetical protein
MICVIKSENQEKFSSCGRCGIKFALAQEVSRHVRDRACKFYSKSAAAASTCTITKVPESPGRDLIETNFDLLSPSFAGNESEENEFRLIFGELEGTEGEEQVAEITFTCKLCEFR